MNNVKLSLIFMFCWAAVVVTSPGCKPLPAEDEATAKKVNTVKRTSVSDVTWSHIFAGKEVYETYCSGCHGLKGDGKGPAAAFLEVQPRNFTKGLFKFISTPPGSLPSDADLHRTIARGIPRSSMPSWSMMSETDRTNVIAYIKTFSDTWQKRKQSAPLAFGNPPKWVGSTQSIAIGTVIYARMGCANCHGQSGIGDGPSAATLTDNDGNKIVPFNFREGVLKGGSRIEDIYRTFYTGLAGTPMPAYGGILTDEENWHLVSYVIYLMGKTKSAESDLVSYVLLPQDTARRSPIAAK
jgi:mono/diheme cytochrome c family protein